LLKIANLLFFSFFLYINKMSLPLSNRDLSNNESDLPNSTIHPFGEMQDSSSNVSQFTEKTPLITPPPTIWTRFNGRYKYGKHILLAAGIQGILLIMFIVIGTLGVFKNKRYRNEVGVTSIGKTKYKGDSRGSWTNGDISGEGDGTYYGKKKKKKKKKK
jgi:hypothetical protein